MSAVLENARPTEAIAPRRPGWPRYSVRDEGRGRDAGLSGTEGWPRVWSVVKFESQWHIDRDLGEWVGFFLNKKTAHDVGLVIAGLPKSAWASLDADPGYALEGWEQSWSVMGSLKPKPGESRQAIKGAWLGVVIDAATAKTLNAPELSN